MYSCKEDIYEINRHYRTINVSEYYLKTTHPYDGTHIIKDQPDIENKY